MFNLNCDVKCTFLDRNRRTFESNYKTNRMRQLVKQDGGIFVAGIESWFLF